MLTISDTTLFRLNNFGTCSNVNVPASTKLTHVFTKILSFVNGNIISVEHKDIGLHAVDAGSYTDIPVDLKQFGMSKIISVIPILQGRSSSPNYGRITLGLYEFNQNTATFRVFNADGSKREPRINACVIGFKQL